MDTIKDELYGLGGDFMKGLRYGQMPGMGIKSKSKRKRLVRKAGKESLQIPVDSRRRSRPGLGNFRNVGF